MVKLQDPGSTIKLPYLKSINFSMPTIELCIGTPCQIFKVGLSSEIVNSYIEMNDDVHKGFIKANSSSYESLNKTNSFLFANNPIRGEKSLDILSFPNAFSFINKTIFILNEANGKLIKENYEGNLGIKKEIAHLTNHKRKQTIWKNIDELYSKGLIESNTIGIVYTINEEKGKGGQVFIGEDSSKKRLSLCNSDPTNPYWTCHCKKITLGGYAMEITSSLYFMTNYKTITIPYNHVIFLYEAMMKMMPGKCDIKDRSQLTILLCDKDSPIETLPDIELYYNYTTAPYVLKMKSLFVLSEIEGRMQYVCLLGSRFKEQKFWIIGKPGYIDNIIVFNNEENTIGFISINDVNDYIRERKYESNMVIMKYGRKIIYTIDSIMIIGVLLLLSVKYTKNIP